MAHATTADMQERWRALVQWRVREVARARGITSASVLAARSGVNKNSMTALWNGTALRIDRDSLAKICTALGCTPGELLVIGGEPPEELPSSATAVTEGSGEGS